MTEIPRAFSEFPTLHTGRLVLRQVYPEDVAALYMFKSDSEVTAQYGAPPHQTPDDTRRWFQQIEGNYARHTAIFWGITLPPRDIIIGAVMLWNMDPEFHLAELGYELNRAYWRQGITLEAARAVVDFGLRNINLHRIEANLIGSNTASRNLLTKLGFTHEGTLRQREFVRDRYEDLLYFGVLHDEWTNDRTDMP